MLNYVFAAGVTIAWLILLSRSPRSYIIGLFATAPWMGLYVNIPWELDLFKAGLLLSPLLVFWRTKLRTQGLGAPLLLLALYATGLAIWQVMTAEVLAFDAHGVLSLSGRLGVQTGMFVLRIILPLLIAGLLTSRRDVARCANAYIWSVFVLSCYGLVQETAFLLLRTPLTPIYRNGIFGSFNEVTMVNIGPIEFLRCHSFCREPKDLALFSLAALALLWSETLKRQPFLSRSRTVVWVQLFVIGGCALLTFSSSLLTIAPIAFLVLEGMRPKLHGSHWLGYALKVIVAACVTIPPYLSIADQRVVNRFRGGSGEFNARALLQPAREEPAMNFLADQWPRSAFGFGVGGQSFYLPQYVPLGRRSTSGETFAIGVDSFWIGAICDLGLVGIFLLMWIVITSLSLCELSKPGGWPIRAALITVFLTGLPMNIDLRGGVMWLFIGLAMAMYRAPARAAVRIIRQAPARELPVWRAPQWRKV